MKNKVAAVLQTVALMCFFICMGSVPAVAAESMQDKSMVKVSGVVVDESGVPVIGATVMVKDNLALGGTVTDLDGRFSISVPQGEVLLVTCLGYVNYENVISRPVSGLKVTLVNESQVLEDAVVVGYGVQQKESVVGAIAQVANEKLVNSGTSNLSNAIAGKLSGVQTFQTSGQPGANNATIVVRGVSSWNGSSPLVMVDGIERELWELDPNEVETISVLKDAAATAVFGAKGANGVILVTTRTGAEGKPKMNVSVDCGVSFPTELPQWVSSYETASLANIAMRNISSFDTQFSDAKMNEYLSPTSALNSIRYPNNNFYDLLLKNAAVSTTANFNMSGGKGIVKYFVSVGYMHDDSIVKSMHEWGNVDFAYDRLNYRSNIDLNITRTTKLSLKVGGNTAIQQYPTGLSTVDTVGEMFTTIYTASPMMYPAYFPDWMLDIVPDPESPNASGNRISSKTSGELSAYYANPYQVFSQGSFLQKTTSKLFTDLVFKQDLDFITKGLSLDAKVSMTTSFYRNSLSADQEYPSYQFDFERYDSGVGNPWISSQSSGDIYVQPPYKMSQDNLPRDQKFVFYWEAALNYARKFKKHSVTGLVLFNQRDQTLNAGFPHRAQGMVARATYNYDKKYLLEVNMGYTGSEQFSRQYRYGFFPSAAVGYVISREKFWKETMPWWSKMKIRYSDGLVGSDNSSTNWLYYASFSTSDGYIIEDMAANYEARWETAHKRDLGIEMGWLDDKILLQVDLFDEQRKDMLITPQVTPLVGIAYKPVNRGAMKKHGIDIELSYRNTTATGFYYEVGGMVGLNENRITAYEDIAYDPDYKKWEGKAYNGQIKGTNTVDGGYFNTIDEIHGYPAYTTSWSGNLFAGAHKYLDYTVDGVLDKLDLHAINGSTYPPVVYSFNLGLSWKGFDFSMLFYGNHGKYVKFNRSFVKEFVKGDYLVHAAQLDYWTPTHRDATHAALAFNNDAMYTWAGGSATDGFDMALEGVTWRKSDYLTLKEVYIGYNFKGKKLKEILGIQGLSLNVTANNLFTFTDLIEGNPQVSSLSSSYYPIMATVKFGLKVIF